MPRLSAFYGIVIYMYIRDHGVAHFHARYGDAEVVIEAATGDELLAAWERASTATLSVRSRRCHDWISYSRRRRRRRHPAAHHAAALQ